MAPAGAQPNRATAPLHRPKRGLGADPPPMQRSCWIRQEPSETVPPFAVEHRLSPRRGTPSQPMAPDHRSPLISCQITLGAPSTTIASPTTGSFKEPTRTMGPSGASTMVGARRTSYAERNGGPGPSHTWSGPFRVRGCRGAPAVPGWPDPSGVPAPFNRSQPGTGRRHAARIPGRARGGWITGTRRACRIGRPAGSSRPVGDSACRLPSARRPRGPRRRRPRRAG